MLEKWQLRQRQSLPLSGKIEWAKRRIQDFYDAFDGNIALSLSGKDSLVQEGGALPPKAKASGILANFL